MPRPGRDTPTGVYHVNASGVSSRRLFPDTDARHAFLSLVHGTFYRYPLNIETYCLLTTHYHLVVETFDDRLSRAIQWLNSRFAERTNDLLDERGHLFGARFWCKPILSDAQLSRRCGTSHGTRSKPE